MRQQNDHRKDSSINFDQSRDKKWEEEETKPKVEKKKFTYQEFRAMKLKEMEDKKKMEEERQKEAN